METPEIKVIEINLKDTKHYYLKIIYSPISIESNNNFRKKLDQNLVTLKNFLNIDGSN